MNTPTAIMCAPDFSVKFDGTLIRRIIEARTAYQNLCGFAPTCIYVNGPILKALIERSLKEGSEVAGMKIVASPESIADMAICLRDDQLFYVPPVPVTKPARGKAKRQ